MAEGNVNQSAEPALPFVNIDQGVIIARDVEDLQIAYGVDQNLSGDPSTYVFVPGCPACSLPNGFAPTFDSSRPLRSLRINIVAHGSMVSLRSDGTAMPEDAGFTVENNTAGYPVNGFRHSWYRRRVEPRNLNPGAL
jgi:hypothetical protein